MTLGSNLLGLMVQVMLPLSLLVAAGGWWAARMGEGHDAGVLRAQLNRLVLYLFYPAILFAVAASTPISFELLTVPLLVGIGTLANGALLYVLLWKTRLGAGLHGYPISYAVNGRQYVAVTTGLGVFKLMTAEQSPEIYQPNGGNQIYVFELAD